MAARAFTLTLLATSSRDAVHDLRGLLKVAWRHFGLRAIAVREVNHPVHRRARAVHRVPKASSADRRAALWTFPSFAKESS
jgi:hypothetical protein